MDAGLDGAELTGEIERCSATGVPKVDWLIKCNPRKTEVQTLAALLSSQPCKASP